MNLAAGELFAVLITSTMSVLKVWPITVGYGWYG